MTCRLVSSLKYEAEEHKNVSNTLHAAMQSASFVAILSYLVIVASMAQLADAQGLSLTRDDATVSIEPYSPNIVRVTLSLRREDALAAPGYGITAQADGNGWRVEQNRSGDVLRSSRMVVTVPPQSGKHAATGTAADIAKFFKHR